jgi:hypothetical protein
MATAAADATVPAASGVYPVPKPAAMKWAIFTYSGLKES